jgi:hypothetical protein
VAGGSEVFCGKLAEILFCPPEFPYALPWDLTWGLYIKRPPFDSLKCGRTV